MGGLDDPTKSVLEIALPALVGCNPVSHCTCSPRMGDVAERRAARRRATHGSEDARPAPACGTRRARERKIITATVAARTPRESEPKRAARAATVAARRRGERERREHATDA